MPSPFGDDEQFPNRPDTLDFWRMSESVLKQDGKASESGDSFHTILAELVDVESVIYMAEQRAMFLINHKGLPYSEILKGLLMSVYLDAFTTGVNFQKAGGTRQEDAGT